MYDRKNGNRHSNTSISAPFAKLMEKPGQEKDNLLDLKVTPNGWCAYGTDQPSGNCNSAQSGQTAENTQAPCFPPSSQFCHPQNNPPSTPYGSPQTQYLPHMSRQDEQREYSMQREAEREARAKMRREISHRSGNEIVQFNGSLCMTSPSGKLSSIMDIAPEKVFYIDVNPLYQTDSYYILIYRDLPDEIHLNEETVNSKYLCSELIKKTGFQIRSKLSENKLSAFLRNYLNKHCIQFHLRYYHGWRMDDNTLRYCHFNSSTHGHRRELYASDFFEEINSNSHPMRTSSALHAVERYAELMDVIRSFDLRCDISMVLHAAFLYSIMRNWGYQLPYGLCFHAKGSGTVAIMKDLLCWYGDCPISLDKREEALLDDLLERKDQPIVIEGVRGSHPNCKLLNNVLQTGLVFRKNNPDGRPLQGLLCAVVQHTSDLSFLSNIATMELDDNSFRADGLSYIRDLLPCLQEYFLNFAAYIIHHAARIKEEFDINMTAFREMDFGYLSPDAESVEAAGILYAIAELVRDYHKSLVPSEKLSARLANLADSGYAERMLERFVNASCNTDDESGMMNLFAAVLQESLDSAKLDLREYHVGIPMDLPDSKTPLVFDGGQRYMLTHTAMTQVVKQTGLPSTSLKQALAEAGILVGARSTPTTYETRITVRSSSNKSIKIPVYMIDKEKLYDPTLYM